MPAGGAVAHRKVQAAPRTWCGPHGTLPRAWKHRHARAVQEASAGPCGQRVAHATAGGVPGPGQRCVEGGALCGAQGAHSTCMAQHHNGMVRPPSLMSPLHTSKNFCARAACSAPHRTWCQCKALLGDGVLARPDTATAASTTGAVSRLGRQAPATLKVPIGTAPCPRAAIPGRPADVVVAADAKGPVARTSGAKGTSGAAAHRGGSVAGAGAGGPSRVAGGVHAVVVTASRKKKMHRRAIHRTHFSSVSIKGEALRSYDT